MFRFFSTSAFLLFLAANGLISAHAQERTTWKPAPAPLMTRWARDVSPRRVLPEYPRPQMARAKWQSLNGLWEYGLTTAAATSAPEVLAGQILVPFPYESSLSGVGKPSPHTQKLWYRRTFKLPKSWRKQRVLLHFGAVNYESSVAVNGQIIGTHQGGFDEFSFDITPQLRTGSNEITVSATNIIDENDMVVGKQRLNPASIFYTAATGIWQSVWLEPVPVAHIDSLKIVPDIDASQLRLTVESGANLPVKATVMSGGKVVASATGFSNLELKIAAPNAKLWSPDAPNLYDLKVELGGVDRVDSYFAMRKISLGKDAQHRPRILLNNRFLMQAGALDQGYWPDGIYTAPTDAALKFDIEIAKKLGFNLLRKHAKVEPARWYYHADKLGMLVWQDMPQMYGGSPQGRVQWEKEWGEIIAEHFNSPSIVVWTTFNEGWGQFDTERIAALTKTLDPSRLVNSASGWTDKGVGDIYDKHEYPNPTPPLAQVDRAVVVGEFGGITLNLGHRWNDGVMGYGATLTSPWLATDRYQKILKNVYAMDANNGLSAFVYTQLTDVEQEINGLLTYDREVMKLDAKIVAAANRGQFLPMGTMPFDATNSARLMPTAQDRLVNWQYSFEKPAETWFETNFDDSSWKKGAAPFGHDIGPIGTPWQTPNIWIRRRFTLPAALPEKLNLLVQHDEDAEIYLNGVLAATVTGYTGEYKVVPLSNAARASLKPGQNTIAAHVHQTSGGQGIDIGLAAAK